MPHNLKRRLREVAKAVLALDPVDPEFMEKLTSLQARAQLCIDETRLHRGNPVNLDAARRKAVAAIKQKQADRRHELRPILADLRDKGFITYRQLAEELNNMKVRPSRSLHWTAASLRRIDKSSD